MFDQIKLQLVRAQEGAQLYPWYYNPLLISDNSHPIVKNLDPVESKFPSSIDTIRNPGVTKTILLHTSDNSKVQMTPTRVHFGMILSKPNPAYYVQKKVPVAVLLEGQFESVFKNRLSPEFLAAADTALKGQRESLKYIDKSKDTKMIVISNGDLIRNDLKSDSSYLPLGLNKFDGMQFANKDFLLNCIQYLADDKGILATRSKDVKLRLLDNIKVEEEKTRWQVINIVLPITVVVLFGLAFNYYRKRKYAS
jgi:gliding-associated putative ABC transporter substrate-binding component GldG